MTTLALRYNYSPFANSRVASFDASRAEAAARETVTHVRAEPASALSPLFSELLTLAKDDGISVGALGKAMDFAYLLPLGVQLPELAVEPDGEVAFDWGSDSGLLSVSVGPTGRVIYAAELAGEPTSGTFQLAGEVPEPLQRQLEAFREG